MKNPAAGYDSLAIAALDCRDELRSFLPRLDAALAGCDDPRALLADVRALVARNADRLRMGLKRPAIQQPRPPVSNDLAPLWRTSGPGGRYQTRFRRQTPGTSEGDPCGR